MTYEFVNRIVLNVAFLTISGDSGSALHVEAGSGEMRVIGVASIAQGRPINSKKIELCNYGVGVARLSYYADFIGEHTQNEYCH